MAMKYSNDGINALFWSHQLVGCDDCDCPWEIEIKKCCPKNSKVVNKTNCEPRCLPRSDVSGIVKYVII